MNQQALDLRAMTRTAGEAGWLRAARVLAELVVLRGFVLEGFVLQILVFENPVLAEDSAPALEVAPPMVHPECLGPAWRCQVAGSEFALRGPNSARNSCWFVPPKPRKQRSKSVRGIAIAFEGVQAINPPSKVLVYGMPMVVGLVHLTAKKQ